MFVGPDDSHVAVVEATGNTVAVFATAATASAAAVPAFTVNHDGGSMFGIAGPLFAGPTALAVGRRVCVCVCEGGEAGRLTDNEGRQREGCSRHRADPGRQQQGCHC